MIAGVDVPEWMEGRPLPKSEDEASDQGREHVFTQYESYTPDCAIVMNTVFKDGWTSARVYERTPAPTTAPRVAQQTRIAEMTDLIYEDLLNRPQLHPVGEPGALI